MLIICKADDNWAGFSSNQQMVPAELKLSRWRRWEWRLCTWCGVWTCCIYSPQTETDTSVQSLNERQEKKRKKCVKHAKNVIYLGYNQREKMEKGCRTKKIPDKGSWKMQTNFNSKPDWLIWSLFDSLYWLSTSTNNLYTWIGLSKLKKVISHLISL